ncbi:MAG: hypothetical protein WA065_08840, partial [Trichococcus flocculiformis]
SACSLRKSVSTPEILYLYYRIWDNKSAVLPVCFGKYFRRGTLPHPKKQQRRGPKKDPRVAVLFIVYLV